MSLDMSLDMAEDALEFIQGVVAHDELSLTGSRVLKRHLGAQFIG
jgi:hypothetical protein